MSRRVCGLWLLLVIAMPLPAAFAGGNIALIDTGNSHPNPGASWCQFLVDHGYKCTVFPKEGPTGPLDPFDVLIDASEVWADPTGTLADFMRAGKTVITLADAPGALGINSNSTVQAWIGANKSSAGSGRYLTTVRDPILGNLSPGTVLNDCADSVCAAVADPAGHPNAKVLAIYEFYVPEHIAIMRNFWEGGVSVYMPSFIPELMLNAVRARQLTIPTLSFWGLLVLALGIVTGGTIVLRRRQSLTRSGATLPILLAGLLAMTASPIYMIATP